MEKMNDNHPLPLSHLIQRLGPVVAVVLLSLAFYLIALSFSTFKALRYIGADIPPVATIEVVGEGKVVSVPDLVSFSFGVSAEDAEAAQAQAQMTKKLNSIMAHLREELGFTPEEITTTSYTLHPRYEWRPQVGMPCTPDFCPPTEGKRELVGFEARATVSVKTKDFDKARKALGVLASLGATNISSLSFTVEDPKALEEEARERAIAQAKREAFSIAHALGVSLGRVVGYTEEGQGTPIPFVRAQAMEATPDRATPPDIAPGETTVRKVVRITYELR